MEPEVSVEQPSRPYIPTSLSMLIGAAVLHIINLYNPVGATVVFYVLVLMFCAGAILYAVGYYSKTKSLFKSIFVAALISGAILIATSIIFMVIALSEI